MKTTIKNHELQSVKILIMLIAFLLTSANLFAQRENENKYSFSSSNADCDVVIKSFTGQFVSGKVYLKWNVVSNIADGYYIIQKSKDGASYKIIGVKENFISPNNLQLLFCFQDENPNQVFPYYKISYVSNDGKEKTSNEMMIKFENTCQMSYARVK